jgi:2-polyprenyl-3-methyl-5-hydroxy-6-metoxy-1,4-benzoquinol methylase
MSPVWSIRYAPYRHVGSALAPSIRDAKSQFRRPPARQNRRMEEPLLPAVEELLAEQVEYYRARAPEYDEGYERRGRYDHGPAANATWLGELAQVRAVLDDMPLDGAQILELAAGTGVWTEALAGRGARVTAIDTSPEMLERNRVRLGSLAANVRYEQADVFSWRAQQSFDAVVFCFWITHVPAERLDSFLRRVAGALRPAGWVFFVDNRRGLNAHDVAVHTEGKSRVTIRRLNDGQEYRVVKHFWETAELEDQCRRAELATTVRETTYFQYGVGQHH